VTLNLRKSENDIIENLNQVKEHPNSSSPVRKLERRKRKQKIFLKKGTKNATKT